MAEKRLTARKVQTINTPGFHTDGAGLYLRVTKAGNKAWVYRYQIDGRRRDMGLGRAADVGLADARERHAEARKMVLAGVDPLDARIAEAKPQVTFEPLALRYIESKAPGWRNAKHAAQWESTLRTYAFPTLGQKPIDQIDTEMVLAVLRPIWLEKPETAGRVRGRIEAVLDYATFLGERTGDNPARWKGHLSHALPRRSDVAKPKHHRSLPYVDMPAFWPRLRAANGASARALEFGILGASRPGEVIFARWPEISTADAIWTIPADRMKAGMEHRVPLTAPMLDILTRMWAIREADDGYVFPGAHAGKPLSRDAGKMLLRRMDVDAVPHGFRATFRTWASEVAGAPEDLCESALAHTKGKLTAAYQRGDLFARRRALMDQWARYLAAPVGTVPSMP